MEVKLGSIPVGVGFDRTGYQLEVFQSDMRDPDTHAACLRLELRREGERSTTLPMILTPGAARALAALLSLPIQAA